jgi:hypothetical protein
VGRFRVLVICGVIAAAAFCGPAVPLVPAAYSTSEAALAAAGSWGGAHKVPGLPGGNTSGSGGRLFSVSCASPGNCGYLGSAARTTVTVVK